MQLNMPVLLFISNFWPGIFPVNHIEISPLDLCMFHTKYGIRTFMDIFQIVLFYLEGIIFFFFRGEGNNFPTSPGSGQGKQSIF